MIAGYFKFYVVTLCTILLLCGCDIRHKEQRHPLFVKANKLRTAGEYSEAVTYYKRFLNVYPESRATHKALATIYDDQLLQYISAIYHYDRYLEYAPNASDYGNMQKWRNAAQRKYYLKARREYNDPNDVQLLKRKNDTLMLNAKKSSARQRRLLEYIGKVKIDIATIRTAFEKLKTKNIDSEIKLARAQRNIKHLKSQLTQVNRDLADVRNVNLKLITIASQDKIVPEQVDSDDNNNMVEDQIVTIDQHIMDDDSKAKKREDEDVIDTETPAEQITPVKLKPAPVAIVNHSITTNDQLYIVKSGDTLSRISRKFYGKSKYYRQIMNANKMLLQTDKDLRPGQQLIIPSFDNI